MFVEDSVAWLVFPEQIGGTDGISIWQEAHYFEAKDAKGNKVLKKRMRAFAKPPQLRQGRDPREWWWEARQVKLPKRKRLYTHDDCFLDPSRGYRTVSEIQALASKDGWVLPAPALVGVVPKFWPKFPVTILSTVKASLEVE